jgi:hypothetical protein
MSERLDLDRQVSTKEGKPTPYHEDIISQIVSDLGGENALSVPDQIRLANVQTAILRAQMKANR